MADAVSILTASTLYPNPVQPGHGIFVETRLRKLVADGRVRAHVLAPVAWMPPGLSYGGQERLRQVPGRETRGGLVIDHPRYLVLPKIGMNLAPHVLYRAMRRQLRALLAEGKRFDVIDAHYFYPDGVAATWLGREFDLPVTITARGTDINLIPEFPYPRRLILEAAQSAAAIITVCQALKDRLVELGAAEKKIIVLRNGVDLEKFRPLDRAALRAKWNLQGYVLASVGLLIERKGYHLVIEALRQIPDATLVIAGSGPERARLEALARDQGVAERVRFLGALDAASLCEIYNCADALVLASSREGWANVLLEAMACGTPVVASSVWGTPEVVSCPEAGVLMPSRDAAGVVKAVADLRRAAPDRAATRRYAEGFGWEPTTNGQVDIFRAVANR